MKTILLFLALFGSALAQITVTPSGSGSAFNASAPGPIGGTTPSTGAFTTLSSTSTLSVGSGTFLQANSTGDFRIGSSLQMGANAATSDVTLFRDAANILAFRNGTADQAFRIYGLYTDASNYHYGSLAMSDAALTISTQTLGTGVDNLNILLTPAGTGKVSVGGHLVFSAGAGPMIRDNTNWIDFTNNAQNAFMPISIGAYVIMNAPAGGNYVGQSLFLTKETTDATVTELTRDGTAPSATTRFLIASGKSYLCDILILGRQSAGGNEAAYHRQVLIRNNAGTTSITNNQTIGTDFESNAAWVADAAADDTNDSLQINVTGVAATTIRWSARIHTTEINH